MVSYRKKGNGRQHMLVLPSLFSPGARTDSESWIHILKLSRQLKDDWTWKERYPTQPEVLEYLNHVAGRFDMRKDIQYRTRVNPATWNNITSLWKIDATHRAEYTCRYFISATGALSVGRDLPIPGVEKFKGE